MSENNNVKNYLSNVHNSFGIDFQVIIKRIVKYFIEGAAVALAAYYIPGKKPQLSEIVLIAITAAATFALLDVYAPSIGNYARQGTGFGIGANLAGFPGR